MRTEIFADVMPVSEKVEKLYRAVGKLLAEGRNVNTLTVSEITEKAGIGKGTAYEYFKSKEEMIARAILYEMALSFRKIEDRVYALTDFRQRYMEVLDWLEEIYYEKGSVAIFCQIAQESMQISGFLREDMNKYGYDPGYVFAYAKEILYDQEGHHFLNTELSDELQECMLISSFATFWIYMNRNPEMSWESKGCLKDYLYRCLMHSLQAETMG